MVWGFSIIAVSFSVPLEKVYCLYLELIQDIE